MRSKEEVQAYPDIFGGQFILDCDAADHGIGAVLTNVQQGYERVIMYGSMALNSACRSKLLRNTWKNACIGIRYKVFSEVFDWEEISCSHRL